MQRQPWLEIVDQRPVAIVNAVSVEDISGTVRLATEQGLPWACRTPGMESRERAMVESCCVSRR